MPKERKQIHNNKMRVHLLHTTPNAERLLSFAKDTRLMGSTEESPHKLLMDRPMEEVMQNVAYSMNTIRGPLEFIHYIFMITNASRALTHQLVRHRVGISFAQQSLRVSDNFGYFIPDGIKPNTFEGHTYEAHILRTAEVYDTLVAHGVAAQDARGVLPIHTTSAIMFKVNLRALLEMFEIRLCLRVQGEHRRMMRGMADALRRTHGWVGDHIGPSCATKGLCAFPRHDCPISKAHPALKGLPTGLLISVKEQLEKLGDIGLQPKAQKEG